MRVVPGLLLVGVTALCAVGGGPDADGDGVPNNEDCRPDDPNLWARPEAGVTDLLLSRSPVTATLTWSRPPDLGGVPGSERYDTLASGDATDFGHPLGFCPEINGHDLSSTDERVPEPGAAWYYLVRVENDCGTGPVDTDPPPVQPRTLQFLEVTNLEDGGPGSLRAAVAAAVGGEAICFEPTGTLALNGPLVVGKSVAIAGPGADLLRIQGSAASYVLALCEDPSISDLTVSGGTVGVAACGSPATVSRATIEGNSSCGVKTTDLAGGMMWGYPRITASTIRNNGTGACIVLDASPATTVIATSTIEDNDVGILLECVDQCMGTSIVASSTIRNNGVGVVGSAYPGRVQSSTITGNDVGLDLRPGGITYVRDCTIAGNQVGVQVGEDHDLYMANSIVSDEIDNQGFIWAWAQSPNLIVDPDCCLPNDVHADPMLGPLGPNGGPTDTFPLLLGSPAIDAGSCAGIQEDQRGFPRPVDRREPNASDGCDFGSYELQ